MKHCNHRYRRWQAQLDGLYRLECADCGIDLEERSQCPDTLDRFDSQDITLDVQNLSMDVNTIFGGTKHG